MDSAAFIRLIGRAVKIIPWRNSGAGDAEVSVAGGVCRAGPNFTGVMANDTAVVAITMSQTSTRSVRPPIPNHDHGKITGRREVAHGPELCSSGSEK